LSLGQLGFTPGGARNFSGRRQPSCDDTSRMMREHQVRICEGLRVEFPGPTRQTQSPSFVESGGRCSSESGRRGMIETCRASPSDLGAELISRNQLNLACALLLRNSTRGILEANFIWVTGCLTGRDRSRCRPWKRDRGQDEGREFTNTPGYTDWSRLQKSAVSSAKLGHDLVETWKARKALRDC
jgi:hypothetical protein